MKIVALLSSAWLLICAGCSQDESAKDSDGADQSPNPPDEAQLVEISAEEATTMKVEQTILPSFSVTELELSEALNVLSTESKKYGEQIGYTPVRFRAEDGIASDPVTLTVKGNSMKTVRNSMDSMNSMELHATQFCFWCH